MKKIIYSILIGLLIVSAELGILSILLKNHESLVWLFSVLVFSQLSTPIIVALIASIRQKQLNLVFSSAIATLLTSVVCLIPSYYFTKSAIVAKVLEKGSISSQDNTHIVSFKIDFGFSAFIGQIILWVLIGTFIGWIVQKIDAKKNPLK